MAMVIGVYGLGRFGAFWAGCLARRFDVVGWSRDPSRPIPPGVRRAAAEDEVLGADVVVYCVTISALDGVLARTAGRLAPGTLVMDTCSVKVHPVRAMEGLLPAGTRYLATHPMFGPDSGRNGLDGLPMVLSSHRLGDGEYAFWKDAFAAMGLRVVEMTPEEHDREAAYTQGITHFIGRVLGELHLKDSVIATAGYESLRNIVLQTCNDPWSLFVDLQKYNPYTVPMRKDLHTALGVMLDEFDSIEVPREG